MKSRVFMSVASFGLAALLFTGCSKIPQAEIDQANAAIEEAKVAGAETYAPDNFLALQDSFNLVMVNLETQKSKMFKNYKTVIEGLSGVGQFAQQVKLESESRKLEVKSEIQNTIAEVKTLIETNRQLILEAPRGKEEASALVAIKGELDSIEATINEANTTLEAGDFMATLEKTKAAREKANVINVELTEVIAKYKGNVRNRKI